MGSLKRERRHWHKFMGCAASSATTVVASNESGGAKKTSSNGGEKRKRKPISRQDQPVCPSMARAEPTEKAGPYVDPWEERTDETSGKIFYVHRETGEHVRNKPDPPPEVVARGTGLKAKRKSIADRNVLTAAGSKTPQLMAQQAQNAKKTPNRSPSLAPRGDSENQLTPLQVG